MVNQITAPKELIDALAAEPDLQAKWDGLTDIGRRDFITWIETAKKEETRLKRVDVAIDKLRKGQKRPCCYAVVPMDLYKALGDNPEAKAAWSKLSADEKRDFSDWVEFSENKEIRKVRVADACKLILAGKRAP